jgi:hypothetical protein
MQVINVEMHHVEAFVLARQRGKLKLMPGQGVVALWIESQRARANGGKLCARDGVATCEQSHLVPHRHELFGQYADDALSAAVRLRRHRFVEGGNLSDAHAALSCELRTKALCGRTRVANLAP